MKKETSLERKCMKGEADGIEPYRSFLRLLLLLSY
jgi:hypothetical protein